jgi:dihydrofolate reductase
MIMVSIIVAMGRNRAIGKDNQLMWHLPADLKHFRQVTMSKPVIMGRKTFESIGKLLPGRTNVVVTRQSGYNAPGCLVAGSLEEALGLMAQEPEVFIAGGGDIYRQAIPLTDRMYITIIDHNFDADTFFPEFDAGEWVIVEERRHEADEKNSYSMIFRTCDRI